MPPKDNTAEIMTEVKNKLNVLAANKDYKAMVDYCLEVGAGASENYGVADPENDAKIEAVGEYFNELLVKDSTDNKMSKQSAETLDGFMNELCPRLADAVVEKHKAAMEYSKRIQSGEFNELRYYKDNKKFADKLGSQMANNFSPEGKKLSQINQIFGYVQNATKTLDEEFSINGDPVRNYVEGVRHKYVKDAFLKSETDIPKEKLDDKKYVRDISIDTLNNTNVGVTLSGPYYGLKDKLPAPGESVFRKVPEFVTEMDALTDKQLLLNEYQIRASESYFEAHSDTNAKIGASVKPLIEKMERMPAPKDKDSANYKAYKDLQIELNNFQKLGTTEFRAFGKNKDKIEDGQLVDPKKINTPGIANIGFRRLENSLSAYKKIDPKFANEVEGFIWEQKQANNRFLNTKANKEKLEVIDLEKKVRGLEGETPDLKQEAYKKQGELGGANGKFQQAVNKMKDAKLFGRGSGEFDKVNELLKKFGQKYNRMIETEKAMIKNGRQNDAHANFVMNEEINEMRSAVAELKKANAAYFAHKRKDGQWKKGTNANADKRIDAVTSVDELMDQMDSMLEMKQISAQRIIKKGMKAAFSLDDQIRQAQDKLTKHTATKKYPNKEGAKLEYATIAAAHLIKAQQSNGKLLDMDEKTFKAFTLDTFNSVPFKTVVDKYNDKEMYEKATRDKGQDMYTSLSTAQKKYQEQEAVKNGNNRTAVKNQELGKPKTMMN